MIHLRDAAPAWGEHYSFSLVAPGDLPESVKNLLMPHVHTIEGATGNHCKIQLAEIINTVIDLHTDTSSIVMALDSK
jgi:hypothetical protein